MALAAGTEVYDFVGKPAKELVQCYIVFYGEGTLPSKWGLGLRIARYINFAQYHFDGKPHSGY